MVNFKADQLRLLCLESQIYWFGQAKRKDLAALFHITPSIASATIREYVKVLAPGNIYYDPSEQVYKPTKDFKPVIFTPKVEQIIGHDLLQDGFLNPLPDMLHLPTPTRSLPIDTLRLLLATITRKESIRIKYQSMNSHKPTWRKISPHAFATDGRRWHTRAYCHTKGIYTDFILGRITKCGEQEDFKDPLEVDTDWVEDVYLVIAPDERLSVGGKRAIELDFCMVKGIAVIAVRKAMLFYILKHWNIGKHTVPFEEPKHQQIRLVETVHSAEKVKKLGYQHP